MSEQRKTAGDLPKEKRRMLVTQKHARLNMTDPALAATLEVHYLRPLLESLPSQYRTAIDVGAHRGDVTEALAAMGLSVLAVEPQASMASRIEERLSKAVASGAVKVEHCAASDHSGVADLLIGRASTVSTLEREWTTVAFPEEFQNPRKVGVPLKRLADIRASQGMAHVGFLKVDVEGHELPALQGLFAEKSASAPPFVVMFEANQRFADQAAECIELLRSRGYEEFDIIIRDGIEPIAAERFDGASGLPKCWNRCSGRYFYANVIAYHNSLPAEVTRPDLGDFIEEYRVEAARDVLRRALRHEAKWPMPVHSAWQTARASLREFLTTEDDWSEFLRHPVCKHMFVRGRWGKPQDFEREALTASAFGRRLLAHVADPAAGSPRLSEQLPALSTNMLGMAYYLTRVHRDCGGRLPATVVEIGGGYGALASLYASQVPRGAYVIVDLPEILAIQHYFLSHALPEQRIAFAASPDPVVGAGTITLMPVSLLSEWAPAGELLVSTFAYSEMPLQLQETIRHRNFFDAKHLFIAGQLNGEAPQAQWVDHGQVVGPIMQSFGKVCIERFHVGENYVLNAER
jgi:putative sugar O-methyltransferase